MENQDLMSQIDQLSELVHIEEAKPSKYPAALGKLNRMTDKASKLIEANGHENKRFKRDYSNGVASYVCPHCSAGALVVAVEGRGKSKMEGEALVLKCSVVNS